MGQNLNKNILVLGETLAPSLLILLKQLQLEKEGCSYSNQKKNFLKPKPGMIMATRIILKYLDGKILEKVADLTFRMTEMQGAVGLAQLKNLI